MKILIVSQYYYPEITAAAFRIQENAQIWANDGMGVTVFTTYPNHPIGKIHDSYKNKLLTVDKHDNITVMRSKLFIQKNVSKFKKALVSLSFMFFGIINLVINNKKIRKDYDIILGTSGPIFAGVLAYIYSIALAKPFVLEIRDIIYSQILATGSKEQSLGFRFIKWLELFLCKKARRVIVVSEGFKELLVKDSIDKYKIEVITNGTNFDKNEEDSIITDEVKNGDLVFSYIGTIGISQDVIQVIDFFNNLSIEKKKLFIIGEGTNKKIIEEYVRENAVKFVEVLSAVGGTTLNHYYNISDFCVVTLRNSEHFRCTIPSKIFQIMGRKKPILYIGPEGEVVNMIKAAECGVYLCNKNNNENVNSFMRFYNDLKQNNFYKLIKTMGTKGYDYARINFDRSILANKYKEIFEEIIRVDNLDLQYKASSRQITR